MSMGINNNYSNYVNSYANAATQKTRQNSQIGKIEATQEDYIKKLQEKNPQIDITIGKPDRTAKTANYTGRTDVRISSKFLKATNAISSFIPSHSIGISIFNSFIFLNINL